MASVEEPMHSQIACSISIWIGAQPVGRSSNKRNSMRHCLSMTIVIDFTDVADGEVPVYLKANRYSNSKT